MKTYQLLILAAAVEQTEDQEDFYRAESGNALARRWHDAVNTAIRSLHSMPERGALCDFVHPSLRHIRRLPVERFPRHLILYRIDAERQTVTIISVIHGARELEAELIPSPDPQP